MIQAGEADVLPEKPVPLPLWSQQIPHAKAWDQIQGKICHSFKNAGIKNSASTSCSSLYRSNPVTCIN